MVPVGLVRGVIAFVAFCLWKLLQPGIPKQELCNRNNGDERCWCENSWSESTTWHHGKRAPFSLWGKERLRWSSIGFPGNWTSPFFLRTHNSSNATLWPSKGRGKSTNHLLKNLCVANEDGNAGEDPRFHQQHVRSCNAQRRRSSGHTMHTLYKTRTSWKFLYSLSRYNLGNWQTHQKLLQMLYKPWCLRSSSRRSHRPCPQIQYHHENQGRNRSSMLFVNIEVELCSLIA